MKKKTTKKPAAMPLGLAMMLAHMAPPTGGTKKKAKRKKPC